MKLKDLNNIELLNYKNKLLRSKENILNLIDKWYSSYLELHEELIKRADSLEKEINKAQDDRLNEDWNLTEIH